MKKVSIQEFNQFYISEILPFIKPYENKRASYNKDFAPLKKVTLTIFFIMIACFVITILITAFNAFAYTINPQMGSMNNFNTLFSFGPIFIIGAIAIMFIFGNLTNDKHKNIKKELQYGLLCKIFSYCNSQISNNTTSEQITLSELQKTSLPIYSKTDDDTLCGYYKNVKFVINEAYAQLGIQSNKTGLFRVLILKLEMNKNFSGQTIVVPKYINYNARNKEEVILEDTNFMKLNNVYSTDQIEARYLLTPSFMEI